MGISAMIYVSGEPEYCDLLEAPVILVTDGSIHELAKYNYHEFVDKIKVVGDLDSMNPKGLPEGVEVIAAPSQDYNDFQKCFFTLRAETRGRVLVYMNVGKRMDHFFCNLDFMNKMDRPL